jgi:YHS domain-containing protein
MNGKSKQIGTVIALAAILLGLIALNGCKKKSEPAAPSAAGEAVSAAIEQTTCPVMEGAVNKAIFTEYKGKKVYFCCPGCKEQFEKEPEKYLAKLPQFKHAD